MSLKTKIKLFIGVMVIGLFFGFNFFYTIEPGEVGIVKRLGQIQGAHKESGIHLKIPLIDSIVKMDARNRKIEVDSASASKDLQVVTSTIASNYSLDRTSIIDLYTTVGRERDIERVLIDPTIEESVKAATAQFNASELITQRTEVRDAIIQNLKDKLESRGLAINAVNIVNFQFSAEFDRAIEQKVQAEQEALKAEKDLARVKFEAQQEIEKAKAEAEKIKIQAAAVREQGGQEYVMLQWISKWDGKLPQTSLGDSDGMIFNLNNK